MWMCATSRVEVFGRRLYYIRIACLHLTCARWFQCACACSNRQFRLVKNILDCCFRSNCAVNSFTSIVHNYLFPSGVEMCRRNWSSVYSRDSSVVWNSLDFWPFAVWVRPDCHMLPPYCPRNRQVQHKFVTLDLHWLNVIRRICLSRWFGRWFFWFSFQTLTNIHAYFDWQILFDCRNSRRAASTFTSSQCELKKQQYV